jgi:hypothetical protein
VRDFGRKCGITFCSETIPRAITHSHTQTANTLNRRVAVEAIPPVMASKPAHSCTKHARPHAKAIGEPTANWAWSRALDTVFSTAFLVCVLLRACLLPQQISGAYSTTPPVGYVGGKKKKLKRVGTTATYCLIHVRASVFLAHAQKNPWNGAARHWTSRELLAKCIELVLVIRNHGYSTKSHPVQISQR